MNLENTAALDWPYGNPDEKLIKVQEVISHACKDWQVFALRRAAARRGWGPLKRISIRDILSVTEIPMAGRLEALALVHAQVVVNVGPGLGGRKLYRPRYVLFLEALAPARLGTSLVGQWRMFKLRDSGSTKYWRNRTRRARRILRKLYGNW